MSVVRFTVSLLAVVVFLALGATQAGALTFTPPAHYRVGSHPSDVATGDLNGDGLPDIAVAVAGSDSVAGDESVGILLAIGNGRFAPSVRVPAGQAPDSIALADLNGDGALDIVTASHGYPDGSVGVLLGRGDGSFVLTGTYPTADRWFDVAVGDLTGDGACDVVAGGELGPALLAGDGAGGLLQPVRLPADGQSPASSLRTSTWTATSTWRRPGMNGTTTRVSPSCSRTAPAGSCRRRSTGRGWSPTASPPAT